MSEIASLVSPSKLCVHGLACFKKVPKFYSYTKFFVSFLLRQFNMINILAVVVFF